MSETRLALIPWEGLPRIWDRLAPSIEKACAYADGCYTPDSVYKAATQPVGDAPLFQVWAAFDDKHVLAVAVTCISQFPGGAKLAELLLVGGMDRHSWLHFDEPLAQWAANEGCDRLRATGRRGWARSLGHEWAQKAVVYERPVPAPERADEEAA